MELVDTFVGKMWLLETLEQAIKGIENQNERNIAQKIEIEMIRACSGYFVSDRIKQSNYENGELNIVKSYLKPGMVCIDVGANVGVYSVLAAHKIGESGVVYAFEPVLGIYEVLAKNSMLYKSIRPFNFGLHNKKDIVQYKNIQCCGSEVKLNVIVGDEFLQDVEKVDFIKIDVDGAEPGVVEGLQNLISRSPKVLMVCELSNKHYKIAGFTETQFFDLVEKLGFAYGRIFNGQIDLKNSRKQLMNVSTPRGCNLLLWKNVEPFVKGM